MRCAVSILVVVLLGTAFATKRYDGHSVARIYMPELEHMIAVQSIADELHLDVWQTFLSENKMDIMIPDNETLARLQKVRGIMIEPMIEDVQALIDEEALYHAQPHQDWWASFHNYQDIVTLVTNLANDNPNIASLFVIGQTLEGRNMHVLKIKGTGGSPTKPIIFIQSLIHAREWITGAVTTWIMNKFITGYGTDPTVTQLLDTFEWDFIPITNPDGYNFAWTGDRLWRKNRNTNGGGANCKGVDNNRNYNYKWGKNTNFCDETYPGVSGGSEKENTNIANFMQTVSNVVAFVDVHAYGQYLLYPYGYTNAIPPQNSEMEEGAIAMQKAIYNTNRLLFTEGNAAPTLYPTLGDSIDWTYGVYNIIYSYVIECRDTGRYGFVLPASQILPAANEIYNAFVAMAQTIM